MAFLKHIGKNGDRKVAIVFRQIPGDEHMCLVVYPDLLPTHIHDPLMKVIESPVGQTAEELADALHRNILPDGRNMLGALHAERMMKRVNTAQVLVTPNRSSNVKLSELNKILNEMKRGEDAVRKMADIDNSAGLVDPKVKRAAEAAFKNRQSPQATPSSDDALSDRQIAANMLAQAQKMESEGKGFLSEAARMRKDAERMDPGVVASVAPTVTADVPKKRGRPSSASKVAAADAA
jgi:hypothetical protein